MRGDSLLLQRTSYSFLQEIFYIQDLMEVIDVNFPRHHRSHVSLLYRYIDLGSKLVTFQTTLYASGPRMLDVITYIGTLQSLRWSHTFLYPTATTSFKPLYKLTTYTNSRVVQFLLLIIVRLLARHLYLLSLDLPSHLCDMCLKLSHTHIYFFRLTNLTVRVLATAFPTIVEGHRWLSVYLRI